MRFDLGHNLYIPLWSNKLSAQDYNNLRLDICDYLKELLTQDEEENLTQTSKYFYQLCALYYAEWYRRDYCERRPTKELIFNSLNLPTNLEINAEDFYQYAKLGMSNLFPSYISELQRQENDYECPFYAILYQGGLPYHKIQQQFNTNRNSSWCSFFKQLVLNRIELSDEEINLGILAPRSSSLRSFSMHLKDACSTGYPSDFPFFCESTNDPLYKFATKSFAQARSDIQYTHPFRIQWLVEYQETLQTLRLGFELNGPDDMSSHNYNEYCNNWESFQTLSLMEEGQQIYSVTYVNRRSQNRIRYRRESTATLHPSVTLQRNNDTAKSNLVEETGDIDMSIPHIFQQKGNVYELTTPQKLGCANCIIIVPFNWTPNNVSQELEHQDAQYNGTQFTIYKIPASRYLNADYVFTNSEGKTITFSATSSVYWTVAQRTTGISYAACIEETIYYRNYMRLSIESDTSTQRSNTIQCRPLNQSNWIDRIALGKVVLRTGDDFPYYITPSTPIFVVADSPEDLRVSITNRTNSSATITINWSKGIVRFYGDNQQEILPNHEENGSSTFVLYKDRFEITHSPLLRMRPTEGGVFDLYLKWPFTDFYISNDNGQRLRHHMIVPVDYLPHLRIHNISNVRGINQNCVIRDEYRRANWRVRTLSDDSTLADILGGLDACKIALRNIHRRILYTITQNGNTVYELIIAEIPFEWRINKDMFPVEALLTTEFSTIPLPNMEFARLYNFDNPQEFPISRIIPSENNIFKLPTDLHGRYLLVGIEEGVVKPKAVYLNCEPTEVRNERTLEIENLKNQLLQLPVDDVQWRNMVEWYEQRFYGMSPTSHHGLCAISENEVLFFRFTYYLWKFNRLSSQDDLDALRRFYSVDTCVLTIDECVELHDQGLLVNHIRCGIDKYPVIQESLRGIDQEDCSMFYTWLLDKFNR